MDINRYINENNEMRLEARNYIAEWGRGGGDFTTALGIALDGYPRGVMLVPQVKMPGSYAGLLGRLRLLVAFGLVAAEPVPKLFQWCRPAV